MLIVLIATVVVSIRSLRQLAPAPTADLGRVQTEAVALFASGLTSTALAAPSATATVTETLTPTVEAAATDSTSSVSATPSCYRLKYVQDVTIPDNTIMTPAEVFTKIWEVENNGTCAWKPGFEMVLVGGVAMGGSPFILPASVQPGAHTQVSIKMAAPTNQTGLITGTWQMKDDAGSPFGDALTVVIVIGNGTNVPATAIPSTTATATP
jgi:hypothetical protein